ncbi:MAG: hypothetical protein LBQ60_02345 [Bacteroidales bacterium]|jgi:hypothetical protein|nr:hypothetical protein [Bacteroidales bacterium]
MKKSVYIIVIGIILGFFSCKDQDSIYEEYIVPNGLPYPGKAINVIASPGKERIKISWEKSGDPKVVKARIFWNNDTESVEVDADPGMNIVSRILELEENTYSFMIRTYDSEGNVSIPVEVIGAVYGEMYERSLVNRSIKSKFYDGQDLTLEWSGAANTEVGINLAYVNLNGDNQTLFVDKTETNTVIPNFNFEHPLSYYTSYKPDTLAIDTFSTQKVDVKIEYDPIMLIPKNTWTEYILPSDALANPALPLRYMWNGILLAVGTATNNFQIPATAPIPCWFTWDLGVKVELDRMRIWPRDHADDRWRRGHPKTFEVYGSLEPNPDGSWDDSWLPLGRFEYVNPHPEITNPWNDPSMIELAREGHEFKFVKDDFADPSVTVRYIRIKILSTYHTALTGPVGIQEISFWGKIVK